MEKSVRLTCKHHLLPTPPQPRLAPLSAAPELTESSLDLHHGIVVSLPLASHPSRLLPLRSFLNNRPYDLCRLGRLLPLP